MTNDQLKEIASAIGARSVREELVSLESGRRQKAGVLFSFSQARESCVFSPRAEKIDARRAYLLGKQAIDALAEKLRGTGVVMARGRLVDEGTNFALDRLFSLYVDLDGVEPDYLFGSYGIAHVEELNREERAIVYLGPRPAPSVPSPEQVLWREDTQ